MSRRILITGASIAGNTAAWWLGRYGFEVHVVERTPEFRDGGQNIDVRGVGREVLRQMQLEQAALDLGTGEEGTAWIDADGSVAAEFVAADLESDGPTAEMEVLRGDLARLLYDAARPNAQFRFGDKVSRIEDGPTSATVTFAGGSTETFDAVIVAEGVGSATRDLVFQGESDSRWMDLTIAYFTIPRAADDDRMWRWYNTTGGRSISLRPDTHGTTRAMLSIQQPSQGEQEWTSERQKVFLRECFHDAGWQAARVLAGMGDTRDFYFDVLRQVRMKHWSKGHVALLGDAAWCATPLAGIGATLAITGARVLAGELQRAGNVPEAFTAFETAMRPMVNEAQGVPKIGTKIMNPHSRLGIHLLHGALNLASRPALRGLAGKLFSRDLKSPDLSRYPQPATGAGVEVN